MCYLPTIKERVSLIDGSCIDALRKSLLDVLSSPAHAGLCQLVPAHICLCVYVSICPYSSHTASFHAYLEARQVIGLSIVELPLCRFPY